MRATVQPAETTWNPAPEHGAENAPPSALCGILGPLHVAAGASQESVPVPPKIRTVLAMLLVHADHVVPVPALMRELWSEQPPVTALRTLQTYILNLRKLLSQVTGRPAVDITADVLVTKAGGYCLHSDDARLDWVDFQRLSDRGKAVIKSRDLGPGIRLLGQALELWRGSALADVPLGPVLEARRHLLEESRLNAVETLVEAKIAAGLHQDVIAELAFLTREHPLHEGLHAQYMRALGLNGRRALALEVFSGLRDRLVREIGIEPGYPLQQLQLAILNSHADDLSPRR